VNQKKRLRHFAAHLVFDSNHGNFANLRMLRQHLLDFAWINIFPGRE
jgi:hypothetical protein